MSESALTKVLLDEVGRRCIQAEEERDAALALLRRLVFSIRLGSIDEAAVREAGRLVGEDGGG